MSFKDTIRQLREKTGASQQDVADAIGIARATYASLEAGRRDPNLGEITSLAKYHEIAIHELIEGATINFIHEPTVEYTRTATPHDVTPREIDPKVKPEKL